MEAEEKQGNANAIIPAWLEPLLKTAFFTICRVHGDAARSECNMFCLDCDDDYYASFCFYCRSSSRHKDHRVIQIRRSSYHDVVRVSEIQNALDISSIQTYVINSARVMFLNERPHPHSNKSHSKGSSSSSSSSSSPPPSAAAPHLCEICGRTLLDPFRFCSLGCKLVSVKRNGNASFSLNEVNSEDKVFETHIIRNDMTTTRSSERETISTISTTTTTSTPIRRSDHRHQAQAQPPPPNTRRRKGVPHRAPFNS